MLFGKIPLLILLADTLALGSPIEARTNEVKITFIGAARAQFTEMFPLDGVRKRISMCSFAMRRRII